MRECTQHCHCGMRLNHYCPACDDDVTQLFENRGKRKIVFTREDLHELAKLLLEEMREQP
jgi:hypothetical protein